MNILMPQHQEFAKKLLEAKVEFILVGDYAVIYHGYARTTGDMDIWLNPTNKNKEAIIRVLEQEGILAEDLRSLKNKDFTKMLAFHIGVPPLKIDFITKLSGVTFEEANKQKVFFDVDGFKIPVIHYNHLISAKIVSDRAKDKADVEELQKIHSLRKKD